MFRALNTPQIWFITLAAAGIMMVTMGARQSLGLFVSPIHHTTGLGIASISFALAVGQFAWGAIQPIAGAIADRYHPGKLLIVGLFLLALGVGITPFIDHTFGLVVSLGLLSAIGSGIGGYSVLMGVTAQRLPLEARGTASGIINAGGSFGQFLFAPILQKLIQSFGWMAAMWSMAAIVLAAFPLIGVLVPKGAKPAATHGEAGLWQTVCHSMKDRNYLLIHAAFFTCGFHIAFLVTHLPGEVNLCGLTPAVAGWTLAIIGLTNIAGSLYAGHAVSRYRSKMILFWMYASRALLVILYLLMPKTDWTFYLFAAGLGFTWLATVPPTVSLVSKLFGVRYLGTLFGLTLLSHQIGGFFGAWLGGITITRFGDYGWMWYADIVLAALAAIANLPIREAPIAR